MCVPVREQMSWSLCTQWAHGLLSMDLNQPSPVLFAQDMPQEAKTTVHVCPGL